MSRSRHHKELLMRTIHKNITLPIDGKSYTFRLCKLDAFSGAQLLQLLRKYLPAAEAAAGSRKKVADLVEPIFQSLTPAELKDLMATALSHTEVLLDAGYQPVMTLGEWSWEELKHDASSCLRLTLESVLWSLDNFFVGTGSPSRPETVTP